MPTPVVAILEDDARRCAAMRGCLERLLPGVSVVFHESALDMVAWLGEHQMDVSLISLDFDLPIKRTEDGSLVDFGTGATVADFLATVPPTCPIIVHTSNATGASRMLTALRRAGWPTARVYPADDLAWISGAWADEVNRLASRGLLGHAQTA